MASLRNKSRKAGKMTDLISANAEAHAETRAYIEPEERMAVADPIMEYMTRDQLEKSIERSRKLMQEAAKKLDFIEAAQYRGRNAAHGRDAERKIKHPEKRKGGKTLGLCLPPFPILYKLPQHTEASVQPQKSKTPTCMQS